MEQKAENELTSCSKTDLQMIFHRMNNVKIHKHCHIHRRQYELEKGNLQTMQNTTEPGHEAELNMDHACFSKSVKHIWECQLFPHLNDKVDHK